MGSQLRGNERFCQKSEHRLYKNSKVDSTNWRQICSRIAPRLWTRSWDRFTEDDPVEE